MSSGRTTESQGSSATLLILRLQSATATVVLALYVAYPTFEPLDVREHIAEYGASWVVSRKEGS